MRKALRGRIYDYDAELLAVAELRRLQDVMLEKSKPFVGAIGFSDTLPSPDR